MANLQHHFEIIVTNELEKKKTKPLRPRGKNASGHKLADYGIDEGLMERLYSRIENDVASGLYPGAAVAMARRGQVIAERIFGTARLGQNGEADKKADAQTLWLLYSQTKPIVSCAIWLLAERGLLNLHHPVSYYISDFARHGKQDITTFHLLTHQAGFPNALVAEETWEDHALLCEAVCNFSLEFQPGAKVFYHSYAAHWVMAILIEAITGEDFRQFIGREVLEPIGLKDILIGVPEDQFGRLAGSYVFTDNGTEGGEHQTSTEFDNPAFFRSGMPGAGGYATAGAMTLFYQMLLGQGELNGVRLLSPRMVQYATTNHTGDREDEFFGMPMHRALGVHLRGTTPTVRGLSSIAHPSTFGHGGVGTSYSFADPASGVAFTYLTNSRLSEPGHSRRLEEIMTMAQAAIVEI